MDDMADDFNHISDLVELFLNAGDTDLRIKLKEEILEEIEAFKRNIENDKYTN